MAELKGTPLFSVYKEFGGKTIDFGGWELPVQFSGIKEEHEAVRTKAGLFDVSHKGEFEVKGPGSLEYLQKMLTNDLSKLKTGGAQYTVMCDKSGGTVDDLLVYKRGEEEYLLVVNAANIEKDYQWLEAHLEGEATLVNRSDEMAQLAIQGPAAERILQKLCPDSDLAGIGFFKFRDGLELNGKKSLVSRTGYTGEDGFEIYCLPEDAADLWKEILEAGQSEGIKPCGLGARDTLRFEAVLPLYGQELSKDISPLEAGIGFAVKLGKEADFIGKEALVQQEEAGLKRKLAGVEMMDRGIPRHGYPVFKAGRQIGMVTTGTQSPTLKKNIGLCLIETGDLDDGGTVEVEIRGKLLKAMIVGIPFYKRSKDQ